MRSSFPQKLLSTSSNLLKKELHSSHFKGVSQKLWNKANKKAFSAFRTFPKICWRWSLFLEKLQTSASNLNTNQLRCSNFQGVSKSFETIKNVSSLWNVSHEIISGKITDGCSVFSLKYTEFLLLSFQRQPLDVFYEKRCP